MNIGVLGGGQLGRMLALAGIPLGRRFTFLDPAPDAPAAEVGDLIVGPYDDPAAIARLLHAVDAVTFEFENVPARSLDLITASASIPVRPAVDALRTGQDRLLEKTLFREVGLHTPAFADAPTFDAFAAAVAAVGLPCVAKTRRMGYDGKGQAVLRDPAALPSAWKTLAEGRHGVLVEAFVPFTRELSLLSARSADGSAAFYPLVENLHIGGILRRTIAPAPDVPQRLQDHARACASAVMQRLDYAGVLAIEFFEAAGDLLGNEMAPRVHNSGHWTIEGAVTSQFEAHIRAVCGLPLGALDMTAPASVMLNLVGVELAAAQRALAIPAAKLHWYGKAPRPDRKVGHITINADSHRHAARLAEEVQLAVGRGCGALV